MRNSLGRRIKQSDHLRGRSPRTSRTSRFYRIRRRLGVIRFLIPSLAVGVAGLLSCGEKDVGPSEPRSELDVVVTTTGDDIDIDGYRVVLDGVRSQPIGVNGTVSFTGLTAGSHTVELSDIAGNCSPTGPNPRTVTLPPDAGTTLSMTITCIVNSGDLGVSVSTVGPSPDPDGYVVTVTPAQGQAGMAPGDSGATGASDPGQSQPVGVNGTVTFSALPAGGYWVELTELAANCTVAEANPTSVSVPAGGTASSGFAVTCDARLGDLEVTSITTGGNLDPDGYTVSVDGGPSQAIATNGTTTFRRG
jgi:hypothetical protein